MCVQNQPLQPNKISAFVKKTLSLGANSIWKPEGYANLITEAASHLTYLETVKSKELPDADSLHYHIENKAENTGSLHKNFLKLTKKKLRKLKGKKVILILDVTHEPFYGRINNNPKWIHEYKLEKGSTGSFKFLSASILAGSERFFVDSVPLSIFYDLKRKTEEMIDRINGFKLKIEIALLDREFGRNSRIIQLLNERKLKYLMLYPEYVNVKRIMKETNRYARVPFEVKGAKTTLVIIKGEKFMWKFVTNMRYYHLIKYIRIYRLRWNIETGFRVADEARIKTKSLDIRVRYFLFLIALILYNIWYLLGKPASFKRFVMKFWDIVGDKMQVEVP